MEKARDGDGNYAAIRDVGRLSLIIEDILLMPDVVAALCGCQDFEVSRIKNRLDPDHTDRVPRRPAPCARAEGQVAR